ncbi:hypothetical protein Tco_1196047 [Tanacetum coccineum]
MAEPILNKSMEKAQTESNLSITSNDINIELNNEFLEELQKNTYYGWIDEDAVNHIAKAMVDKRGEGKITVWEELVEIFFYKFYPDSYDGEEEMLDEGENWRINPLEFISRVNSSFDKHMKIDGRTKKVLFHAWMNGNWNKRRMDDSILSSNNTTTDSFFKPYLITSRKSGTEKQDEQSQTKRKYSNASNYIDEQPNKRRCKVEKFEAIRSISNGMFIQTPAEETEGALQLGPERARVFTDLSAEEKERYKADIRATNILLQGIPKDIYTLINHYTDAKDIWDNVKMILEGSELTKDDRESQLYDEFEHFRQIKGETIHVYYVRFTKLINDMRNIKMTMPRMQLNSKFVNNMLPEWSRFITEVKLNRGLKESNFDQLYAYLKQHEVHANENRMMMERFIQPTDDPLCGSLI